MKLLLVQPPIRDFYDTDIRLEPIGLCYLKAAVRKYLPEIKVVVKDYHQGRGRRSIPVPPELGDLKSFYPWHDKSPFSTFYHYYHFGAPFQVIAEDIAEERPDLIILSSLFSAYHREVLCTAQAVKQQTDVPIMAGGPHVTAMPLQMLNQRWIDFIIRGEGERPLVEFLKAWTGDRQYEKVPNLGWKRDGRLVLNDNAENFPVDELPVPDFSDFPVTRYLFEKHPLCFIITSRGCPHGCGFCSVQETFGAAYRRRSIENILREIKQRYEEGYRVFDFEDDNFTFDRALAKELCQKLTELFPKRDVRMVAMNGIAYWHLDTELLGLMQRAGFTHLNIALVSLDAATHEAAHRPHSTQKYLEVVRESARLGLKTVSYQILGFPGEPLESMIQTLAFSAGLPVLLGASPFYLTPGSPMADRFPPFSDEDLIRARLTALARETDQFKREDIYTLFITTRIINFLKSIPFDAPELALKDALAVADGMDARMQTGAELLRRLFKDKTLFAATEDGLKPLAKFKPDLFILAWSQIRKIGTQAGKAITGLSDYYA
ncbi:MAG: radical SAM protein [Candidatus Omnitrophica bacterium]|nr:radical SAM protein [Candidatus Omnitrophota bacterium]MDD5671710.1 radical SAM protein [Candidatus Omnitrophota bacterium]